MIGAASDYRLRFLADRCGRLPADNRTSANAPDSGRSAAPYLTRRAPPRAVVRRGFAGALYGAKR